MAGYSVDGEPQVGELGNMWVRPSEIGTGIGRVMWQDEMAVATAARFEYLQIGSEPTPRTSTARWAPSAR